ncbi:MAG TPA: hypothetical protein DCP32_04995 [Anaerolineaceae bacterium]|nr:hypothetical protein [Anaerolineaceae bacterium]
MREGMSTDLFNRENGIPVYRQLAEFFKTQISSGVYRPGDVLPSESDCMREYTISRTTVRLAFGLLSNAGLVRREPGIGTTVISQVLSKLPMLSSFTEEVTRLGRTPGVVLVARAEEGLPLNAANALDLPVGQKVLKVIRLRTADAEPIGLAVSWLNTARQPELRNMDHAVLSLYRAFESDLGLTIWNAHENIRADLAGDYEARKLKIKPGSPVLRMTRTTYVRNEDESRTPIEYVEVVFNASVYSVDVELYRQSK